MFAKLKHLLRKAAARSREAVCATIGQLLDTYTPQECANYLTNSGYSSTQCLPALTSRVKLRPFEPSIAVFSRKPSTAFVAAMLASCAACTPALLRAALFSSRVDKRVEGNRICG